MRLVIIPKVFLPLKLKEKLIHSLPIDYRKSVLSKSRAKYALRVTLYHLTFYNLFLLSLLPLTLGW